MVAIGLVITVKDVSTRLKIVKLKGIKVGSGSVGRSIDRREIRETGRTKSDTIILQEGSRRKVDKVG